MSQGRDPRPAPESRLPPAEFVPSFKDLQRDVESYLASTGRRRKTPDGFIVFDDYDGALARLFDEYLARRVYDPLVDHFRRWNWEHSYNSYLLRLTEALLQARDWPRLERLWGGVIARRRKLYNDIRKLDQRSPGALPEASVQQSRERLLESLERVRAYSADLGSPEDALAYAIMIERVKAGKKV